MVGLGDPPIAATAADGRCSAIAVFQIVDEPVLSGAGMVGVAIGFGAQSLVRVVFSGLFLILEDQVRVGDVALINNEGGLIEAVEPQIEVDSPTHDAKGWEPRTIPLFLTLGAS